VSETFDLGSTRLRVLLAEPVATILEGELDPGAGSSWHTHHREDEIIVVLEGTLVVNDDERHELGPGDAYVLSRGVRHSFGNESQSLTRLYFFCSPGGLERFFRDLTSGLPPTEAALRAELVFE
jgi:quercetin dioxygenase-like cupin family protein